MQGASLCLVIPVYNEEENLPKLANEIEEALSKLPRKWEALFIDDGSWDGSLGIMRKLAEKYSWFHYLAFQENCGQSAAFSAGFQEAKADIIITMDADLQNDPADIPMMLAKYDEGYEMVIGWRAERQDSLMKRFASKVGNSVRNFLTREDIKDTGCSLKLLKRDMAIRVPMFTGMHRFLPTLMKMQGARVAEVKVNHRPRLYGESKYGVWDRGTQGLYDLFAVRWMQKRHFNYRIKERK